MELEEVKKLFMVDEELRKRTINMFRKWIKDSYGVDSRAIEMIKDSKEIVINHYYK